MSRNNTWNTKYLVIIIIIIIIIIIMAAVRTADKHELRLPKVYSVL